MELQLPGFRFHPTEEELLDFYLRRMAFGKKLPFEIISTVHLYRHDPWELPGLAKISGEREWYFYVPRDRKQGGGGRPSRITERGFWKATGCDRPVRSAADPKRLIGLKKTLVYYEGRAPRGTKTDWVMNEYRLPEPPAPPSVADSPPLPKEDVVLCKVYRKATSMKELEQRAAAMEEEDLTTSTNSGSVADSSPEWSDQEFFQPSSPPPPLVDDVIIIDDTKVEEIPLPPPPPPQPQAASVPEENTESIADYSPAWWPEVDIFEQLNSTLTDELIFVDIDTKREEEEEEQQQQRKAAVAAEASGSNRRPASLPELVVPKHTGLEWMQDSFLTQLRSPWMVDNLWSPSFASILNF